MMLRLRKRSLLSAWILLGIALLPIYIWSSGGVQLSHMVLFVGAVFVFASYGFRLDMAGVVLGLLVVYIGLRDGAFSAQNASVASLLPVLYALFSWMIYVSLRQWLSDSSTKGFAVVGALLAAAIAMVGVLAMGYGATTGTGESYRSVGTFNNPNQLGYFAVCLSAISILLFLRGAIGLLPLAIFQSSAFFLATASLSKAAMVSCAFAALLMGFTLVRSRGKLLVGLVVAGVIFGAFSWVLSSESFADYKAVSRLQTLGTQSDDSLEGRGYGVLLEMGAADLVFGFGAQEVNRRVGHEVHSTVFSYFANYGFVGWLLFMTFLALWARRVFRDFGWLGVALVVMPPMLYGLTHNGSRFTIFWLLLAMSMSRPQPRKDGAMVRISKRIRRSHVALSDSPHLRRPTSS